MKNLFLINEEEKNRILGMHETATKKLYLSEQPTTDFGQQEFGPQTLQDTAGTVVKKGLAGDPYVYAKLGNDFYYAKASDGDYPDWVLATNPNAVNSIKGKIYNEKVPPVTTVKAPVKGKTKVQPKKTTTKPKTTKGQDKSTTEMKVAKKVVGTTMVADPNAYLQFNGDQLQWVVNGSVVKTWKAISGLTLFNTPVSDWNKLLRRFTNSPEEFSKDKNAGPTPPGKYVVGPIQKRQGDNETIGAIKALWEKIIGKFNNTPEADKSFQSDSDYSKIGWGNFRATITPQSGTNTYGRSSFYIHGGTLPGSHGCIDLTSEMDDFAKFYGTWLSITKKNSIPLVVNYKTPSQNTFIQKLWSGNPEGSKRMDDYRMKNKFYTDPGKI